MGFDVGPRAGGAVLAHAAVDGIPVTTRRMNLSERQGLVRFIFKAGPQATGETIVIVLNVIALPTVLEFPGAFKLWLPVKQCAEIEVGQILRIEGSVYRLDLAHCHADETGGPRADFPSRIAKVLVRV